MSGVHKNPTISFRVSDRQREQIEAKIIASGMSKKDYFIRSCIYNRICVVGKKELIYRLVQELHMMQSFLQEIMEQMANSELQLSQEGMEDMRNEYNRFNQNPKVYSCEACKTVDALTGSYIALVEEEAFLSNPTKYIDNAYDKSENDANGYDLTKTK